MSIPAPSQKPLYDLSFDTIGINAQYSTVKYIPNNNTIKYSFVKEVGIASEEDTMMPMDPISGTGMNTQECAKRVGMMYSDVLYNDKKSIDNNVITRQPGLSYKIVGEYMDTPYIFVSKQAISSGVATDFTSINKAINDTVLPANDAFCIEWFGYVIPTKSGSYRFNITTSNKVRLWVGDKAINDYTIENAKLSVNNQTQQTGINMKIGKIYPIRIQYNNGNNTPTFSMQVAKPNGSIDNNILYTLYNGNSIYEKPQIYFGLGGSRNNPRNQVCYYLNPTNAATSEAIKNANKNNKYVYSQVYTALSSNVPRDIPKIQSGNYAMLTVNNASTVASFNLYNSSGVVVQSILESRASNTIKRNYSIVLTDTGEIQLTYTPENGSRITIEMVKTPGYLVQNTNKQRKPNDNWGAEVSSNRWSNVLLPNIKLDINLSLISRSTTAKMKITRAGNLAVYLSKPINTSNNRTERIKLHKVNMDAKTNKMFYVDGVKKEMEHIPYNNSVLKANGDFLNIGNYEPPNDNMNTETNMTLNNCKQKCINDVNCDYLYSMRMGNETRCVTGKNNTPNIIPNELLMRPSNMSELYIKDKQLDLSANYMLLPISNTYNTRNSQTLNKNYKIQSSQFDRPKAVGLLVNDNYKAWKNSICKFINGTDPNLCKDGMQTMYPLFSLSSNSNSNIVEGAATFTSNICNTNTSTTGCINDISGSMIAPLKELNAEYKQKLTNMGENYNRLTSSGVRVDELYKDMSNNSAYDFSARDYTLPSMKEKTLLDTMKEDIKQMELQTNTMYISGTLASATLLIVAIMLAR